MGKGLVNSQAFSRVKHETLVQEILKLVQFPHVRVVQRLTSHQVCQQVPAGRNGRQQRDFLLKREKESRVSLSTCITAKS